MKRKVARIGPATLMISLPSKWVKQFSINKGDEIDVCEEGEQLILTTSGAAKKESKTIDITNLPKVFVMKSILSLYKQGYDEITINFQNRELLDLKENKMLKTEKAIHEAVESLVGFEVIEQRSNSINIKNISRADPEEFNNILRRIFILIKTYSEESINAIRKNDKEELADLSRRKSAISRFIYYASRLLTTRTITAQKDAFALYLLLEKLYDLLNVFAYINSEQANKGGSNGKLPPKPISVYEKTNEAYNLLYTLFYKFDKDVVAKIFQLRRKCFKEINEVNKAGNIPDLLFCARLAVALNTIHSLTETVIGMKCI